MGLLNGTPEDLGWSRGAGVVKLLLQTFDACGPVERNKVSAREAFPSSEAFLLFVEATAGHNPM